MLEKYDTSRTKTLVTYIGDVRIIANARHSQYILSYLMNRSLALHLCITSYCEPPLRDSSIIANDVFELCDS